MSGERPPRWGGKTLLVAAIIDLGLPVISRRTLREIMPERGRKPYVLSAQSAAKRGGSRFRTISKTTMQLTEDLRQLELAGYIVRGQEYIKVTNRRGLVDWLGGLGTFPDPPPLDFTNALNAAIDAASECLSDAAEMQREAELDALRRLMQEAQTRPGRVRIVNRTYP